MFATFFVTLIGVLLLSQRVDSCGGKPVCILPQFTCTFATYTNNVRELNAYFGWVNVGYKTLPSFSVFHRTDGVMVTPPQQSNIGGNLQFGILIRNLTWVVLVIDEQQLVKNITFLQNETCNTLFDGVCNGDDPDMPLDKNFCEDTNFCNGRELCVGPAYQQRCQPATTRSCPTVCREDTLQCV